jgi:hypothetical protein
LPNTEATSYCFDPTGPYTSGVGSYGGASDTCTGSNTICPVIIFKYLENYKRITKYSLY